MKLSIAIIFAVAIFAVSAKVDLPDCATGCAAVGLSRVECSDTDFKCMCSDKGLITAINDCITTACNAADREKTINIAIGLCKGFGVDIPRSLLDPVTTESTSTAKSTSTATVKPTSTATVEPASTTTVEPTSTAIAKPTSTTTVEPTSTATVETTATTSANVKSSTTASTIEAIKSSTPENVATANAAPTALGVSGMMGAVGAAAAMFLL